jgi:hypothetical protein
MDMDLDAIRAKLKAKGAQQVCPVCAHDVQWELGISDDATAYLWVRDPARDTPLSLHVIPLVCPNCGFIRFHSSTRVLGD